MKICGSMFKVLCPEPPDGAAIPRLSQLPEWMIRVYMGIVTLLLAKTNSCILEKVVSSVLSSSVTLFHFNFRRRLSSCGSEERSGAEHEIQ